MRGDYYINSCSRDEVSYAFHIQEEDITPQKIYLNKVAPIRLQIYNLFPN